MTSEEFSQLYSKTPEDDLVTAFTNEVGFSLIRNYPKNTLCRKNERKIFLKLTLRKEKLVYSVNMTRPELGEHGEIGYYITEDSGCSKKTTNFFSDDQGLFIFNEQTKKVVFKSKNRNFTLNEFIEILVQNHLSDHLYFKRTLNLTAYSFLKLLFWLSDKHYDKIKVFIDKYHSNSEKRPEKREDDSTEPFFKYFSVSKNILFTTLLLAFSIALISLIFRCLFQLDKLWPFGEFSLSNPFVTLFFFLILFLCEKFSIALDKSIKNLFKINTFPKKEVGFIERLHNYQYSNKFNLRIK